MDQQIINLLQITNDEYEIKTISTYLSWCNKYASSDKISQRLISSPALFNWWITEFKKFERKFLELATPYKSICNKTEMHMLYRRETMQIFARFSKPLIYCAKHKKQDVAKLN